MLGISKLARHRVLPLLVALVAMSLAGCSDDGEPAGTSSTPTPSTSPSAEPTDVESSPSQDAGPEGLEPPKAPRVRDTPGSRKNYASFVVERWGYALATNDAKALTSLSARGATCQGCPDLRKELRKRKKQDWHVEFPGATVDKVTVKRDPAGPGKFASTARVDIPASRSYFKDGTYRNDNAAHKNASFVIRMRFTKKRYVLLSYRVDL